MPGLEQTTDPGLGGEGGVMGLHPDPGFNEFPYFYLPVKFSPLFRILVLFRLRIFRFWFVWMS